jgi:hypothetical protein
VIRVRKDSGVLRIDSDFDLEASGNFKHLKCSYDFAFGKYLFRTFLQASKL